LVFFLRDIPDCGLFVVGFCFVSVRFAEDAFLPVPLMPCKEHERQTGQWKYGRCPKFESGLFDRTVGVLRGTTPGVSHAYLHAFLFRQYDSWGFGSRFDHGETKMEGRERRSGLGSSKNVGGNQERPCPFVGPSRPAPRHDRHRRVTKAPRQLWE